MHSSQVGNNVDTWQRSGEGFENMVNKWSEMWVHGSQGKDDVDIWQPNGERCEHVVIKWVVIQTNCSHVKEEFGYMVPDWRRYILTKWRTTWIHDNQGEEYDEFTKLMIGL